MLLNPLPRLGEWAMPLEGISDHDHLYTCDFLGEIPHCALLGHWSSSPYSGIYQNGMI